MPPQTQSFQPGQRVVVTQQIPQRDDVWQNKVEGVVVRYEQRKTGSWYAHSKDDKLWLDRLTLRKADGEIVVCSLDKFTHVDMLPPLKEPPAPPDPAPGTDVDPTDNDRPDADRDATT